MKNIAEIDKNLAVETNIEKEDICFYDIKKNDWCLTGLTVDGCFMRMPEKIAESVSENVHSLNFNTSGGRITFVTDSEYAAISAKMPVKVHFPHMPHTGVSGFDLYVDGRFFSSFIPPVDMNGGYESVIELGEKKKRTITINFPLYNNVDDLYLGLQKDASFEEAPKRDKRIVFYGSSITQGGCVSRPGLAYPAIVADMCGLELYNLGFSGSALAENEMAEYIAGLKCDIFVLDYDHNAPNAEHLDKTHERLFKIFREKNPGTPVVIASAPDIKFHYESFAIRRESVKRTYSNAVAAGDENVYFIDGETFFGEDTWDMCSMDTTHPNDWGHYRMATAMKPVIEKILSKQTV